MEHSDEAKWIELARRILGKGVSATYELPQFAISMLTYFYGSGSPQTRSFQQTIDNAWKNPNSAPPHHIARYAAGAVRNTVNELENGLVGNLRTSIQGEILGDFASLAKESLSQNSDTSKNVAAVLVAAAFEDCLRRLAAEKANVQGRPKLEAIIGILKDAEVLKGGNLSLASSMLKFRNDSLHADWQQVQRAQVESCLALTESLLREHFS